MNGIARQRFAWLASAIRRHNSLDASGIRSFLIDNLRVAPVSRRVKSTVGPLLINKTVAGSCVESNFVLILAF
jgi:hypothetical protein